jgi:hypothetical protein
MGMTRTRRSFLGRLSVVVVSLLLLGGCLQFESLITVNSDGSGTIEQRFVMKQEFVDMMAGMQSMQQSQEGSENEDAEEEASGFSLLDPEQLRSQASSIGEGVRFVSGEEIADEFGQGYVAVYEFDDVSKIQVNQNPGDLVPQTGGAAPTDQIVENITFSFREGATSELVIELPEPEEVEADGAGEQAPTGSDEMNPEMFQQFYQDMRIAMRVRVDGRVVSSNATSRDGNTLTLMDIDFNRLMAQDQALERVLNQQPETIAEMQQLVADVDGMDVETEPRVTIRFR